MYSKPLIFMIISVLVVALIFSPTAISHVFAVPPNSKFGTAEADCTNNVKELTATCCWSRVTFDKVLYECQTCNINTNTGNFEECTPVTRERGGGGFDPAIPGGGIFQTSSAPLTPDDNVNPNSGGVFNTPQTGGGVSLNMLSGICE